MKTILFVWTLASSATIAFGAELAGHKFLLTSVRTGDTEVFVVDPETGDLPALYRPGATARASAG